MIVSQKASPNSGRLAAFFDDNPFGVAVNLRGGLAAALDRIEGAMAA